MLLENGQAILLTPTPLYLNQVLEQQLPKTQFINVVNDIDLVEQKWLVTCYESSLLLLDKNKIKSQIQLS